MTISEFQNKQFLNPKQNTRYDPETQCVVIVLVSSAKFDRFFFIHPSDKNPMRRAGPNPLRHNAPVKSTDKSSQQLVCKGKGRNLPIAVNAGASSGCASSGISASGSSASLCGSSGSCGSTASLSLAVNNAAGGNGSSAQVVGACDMAADHVQHEKMVSTGLISDENTVPPEENNIKSERETLV